ncbi:hypothetical protein [Cryobacterium sp. BB736]|uniref:hypothetical protein n=1 Tax=Cryobacterium sp. BB736 TaxID=2746963 RepID=UPI0018761CE0|nr:hypothetical protein [Cryobacterium sp. BB736]
MTTPQIVLNNDTARTRETDPVTSHIAADLSALTLNESRRNVLELIKTHGASTGSEVNHNYHDRIVAGDWPPIHWDSPRRRAGELADAGFLARRGMRMGLYTSPETEYELTFQGLAALEVSK